MISALYLPTIRPKRDNHVFKSAIFYAFEPGLKIFDDLESKLEPKKFRGCGKNDFSVCGWSPIMGEDGKMLTHSAMGFSAFAMCIEEKILPASVIKDEVNKKVRKIEQEQGQRVSSSEKKAFKEDVVAELLPSAFTRKKVSRAFVSPSKGLLVVEASSFKTAEMLTSMLRECLGSLPIVTPQPKNSPSWVMTCWLTQESALPDSLSLGTDCELKETGEGELAKATISNEDDLLCEEVTNHIQSGKMVKKLALESENGLSFAVSDQIIMTKLKATDIVEEQIDDIEVETESEHFDAMFSVFCPTLCDTINDLIAAFGGLNDLPS